MKEAANTKKKLADKQAKAQEKAKNRTNTQALDMMTLAITNRGTKKIRAFKDILSDLIDSVKNLVDNTTPTFILPPIPFS